MKKQISIIIPTYNEAKNLPLLFDEIDKTINHDRFDVEFIVVDDNSPDGTGEVADNLKQKYNIQVIHRSGKLGLGSAVREGFVKSSREYLGVMDADLSHDPSILNDLFSSLGNYDIVLGSRFMSDSIVENWSFSRRFTSRVGVKLAYLITGVNDPLSGYFFFKKKLIKNVNLTTKGYKILFEILTKTNYQKVLELPFKFRMRQFSTSKLNFQEYLLFFGQLLKYGFYKLINSKNK